MDYIAQAPAAVAARLRQRSRRSLQSRRHDGETLYVEVDRPDPAAYPTSTWPVILEASPYHGTLADREGTRIFPDPVDADGNPIGLTGYFAPRGYAVVMMDLRGTGRPGLPRPPRPERRQRPEDRRRVGRADADGPTAASA